MATENAIHEDADDESKPVEHEQPADPREAALDAIEAAQIAAFNSEADGDNNTASKPADKADTSSANEQIAAQLAEDDKPTVLADGFDKYQIKTKVDGVEQSVSLSDVVRRFQKNEAADKRLAEATRILDDIKRAPPSVQEASAETKATEPPVARKKFLDALFQGDEDGAMKAFDEALGDRGRPPPTLDRQALLNELAPALKQQLVVESALDKFNTDYADITSDTYLAGKADSYLKDALDDGKNINDALTYAGNATRDWIRSKAGVAPVSTQPTTNSRNERLERKAAIDSIPSTSAKAVIPQMREENPGDVIAEMRLARGQE